MSSRTTQHRAQRDETKAKEMSELKKENRSLRKQLVRLRKQLLKVMELHNQHESEAQDEQSQVAEAPRSNANGCEACGGANVARVAIPSGTLIVCKDCSHRKTQKNE